MKRLHSIHDVSAEEWNRCTGTDNPFLRHEFFAVLEDSNTAVEATGWEPAHLLLFDGEQLLGLTPTFIKTHSEGEFVFDYSWASAYQRLGGAWYPKLQCAVPYSPIPGARWPVAAHLEAGQAQEVVAWLQRAQMSLAESLRSSSVHATFCSEAEYQRSDWLKRVGVQFHFDNPGYADFADFTRALNARKRKAVLKERAGAQQGLTLEALSGDQLRPEHMDVLYRCYRDTSGRKWGRAALTRPFFHLLRERMADQVVLMLARRDDQYIAAALNLKGKDTLYGRNWGCLEDVPFLHFELCYYMAIDYAIQHGLKRVEAGAQGFHKVARGYLPQLTYSLHWIAHPGFRALVAEALDEERAEIESQLELIRDEHSPFKQAANPTHLEA